MSYCRWSSDDYQCDLYVYEDIYGGWTTHVAGKRRVFKEPLPPPIPMTRDNQDACWERYTLVNRMVDESDLVDIGLPADGKSFNDPTLEALLDRVKSLIDMGYRVPPGVLERIEEEIREGPIQPDGTCQYCGRDYGTDMDDPDLTVGGPCPSDDCPSNVEMKGKTWKG